jgi:hypothetical protein
MQIQSKAESSFVMLDRICEIQFDVMKGMKTFNQAPACLAIESCAQLGAFHIRFNIGFCRHVFLIKVKEYALCPTDIIHGSFSITGTCLSRSSDAFLYAIQITNDKNFCNKGTFLFGVADYDERFDNIRLTKHYQDIFSDLYDSDRVSPKSKGIISLSDRMSCNA